MLLTLLKSILPAQADDTPEFHRRQINLSGNILEFSMPENFSRDMPANDMIENVNLTDPELFKNSDYITLIRRWWDFKQPGFFGDDMGSIMMSISITNSRRDILDQISFVSEIDEALHMLYDQHNNQVLADNQPDLQIYLPFLDGFENIKINNQRWIRSGIGGQILSQLNFLPISTHIYLILDFTYLPNEKYVFSEKYDDSAFRLIDSISSTIHLSYKEGNPARIAVEGNEFSDMKTVIKTLENSLPADYEYPLKK